MKDSESNVCITEESLENFRQYLIEEERSLATVAKYVRDVQKFLCFLNCDTTITREKVLEYKQMLVQEYKATSVNSMLAALNQFFRYLEMKHLCVKKIKIQRAVFREENQELTLGEYKHLVQKAYSEGNEKLGLILETICSTGIRISELRFFTIQAVKKGSVQLNNKGKVRTILLPNMLQKKLLYYIGKRKITNGCVFVTSKGKPLDRSNIWRNMKKLGDNTHVLEKKIYPHNLRHLFAKSYYSRHKDVIGLADILGHTSVDTTKIYTITNVEEYRRKLNQLQLIS